MWSLLLPVSVEEMCLSSGGWLHLSWVDDSTALGGGPGTSGSLSSAPSVLPVELDGPLAQPRPSYCAI